MVTISTSPDCGNAPKQAYVRDVLAAAARADRDAVASAVSEGWAHRLAGEAGTSGDAATDALVAALTPEGLHSVAFSAIMSHGKLVAASGTLHGARDTEFCCMITFSGHGKTATIAECVTYLAPAADA
jgi:hypothetical protein